MKLDDTNYKIKKQSVTQTDCMGPGAEKGLKPCAKFRR